MDNAVIGTKSHTSTVREEIREFLMGFDVSRLGIGGGVTEALNYQVGTKS
jgi:hypothetical protein